jgi:predicted  nucleic acid-binding Zn-ribbon protein
MVKPKGIPMWRLHSTTAVLMFCLALPCMGQATEPEAVAPAAQEQRARADEQRQVEDKRISAQADARMQMLKEESAEIQNKIATLRDEAAKIGQDIHAQTDVIDPDSQTIRHLTATLEEQHEQMELEAAGATGRREALEETVARVSKQLDERAATDPVAQELTKVLEVREKQLDRIQNLQKNGVAPAADSDTAEAAVASARAELAAARQKAVSSTAAESLETWNRQLLELTIADRERQARLRYVEKRLSAFSSAAGELNSMEQLRQEMEQLRQESLQTQQRMEELKAGSQPGIIYQAPPRP